MTKTDVVESREDEANLSVEEFMARMNAAEFAAWRAEGYTKRVEGEEQFDPTAFTFAVFEVVSNAYVKVKKEKASKALTFGALAVRVFPNHPVADGKFDDLGLVEQKVWSERLLRSVKNAVQPNHSGKVQKLVGDKTDGLILVQGDVEHDGDIVRAVYVTDAEELIFTDFTQPLKDSVRRASEKLAKNLAMVSTRQPQLAPKATEELAIGMSTATNHAKALLALTTGNTDESDKDES